MDEDKRPSPGYLWRPGSSTQDNPLLVVVAVVITLVVIGAVVLATI